MYACMNKNNKNNIYPISLTKHTDVRVMDALRFVIDNYKKIFQCNPFLDYEETHAKLVALRRR